MESNKDKSDLVLEQTEYGSNLTVTRERVTEIIEELVGCLPPLRLNEESAEDKSERDRRHQAIIDSLTDDEYGLFFDVPEEGYVAPRPKGSSSR